MSLKIIFLEDVKPHCVLYNDLRQPYNDLRQSMEFVSKYET